MKPSHVLPRLVSSLSLLAVLVLAPARAAAQPDEASKHYDAGVTAMEGGDCATAEEHFEKAMALKPHYQIAGNLGACELELKKFKEAAEHLHWALKALESEAGREQEKEALGQMLERSRLQVGSLRIAVSGYAADQAQITLDGQALTKVPELLFVTPGKHTVAATSPGAETVSVEVSAAGGETVAVALPLKQASAAPDAGTPATPPPAEEEQGGLTTVPFWSAVAATVIFTGVGVGVLIAAGGSQSDADARRDEIRASGGGCADDCPELVSMYEDADTLYNASAGLFIFGGVCLISSVVYGVMILTEDDVVDESAVEEARLEPTFAITPNGDAFVGLSGRF
jgi:tetratricopeptide (TPR) repeat protein